MKGLEAGFNALNSNAPLYEPVAQDLRPHEICVDYPLDQEQWPAVLVEFHPTRVRPTGLNPEQYTQPASSEYGMPVGTIATYFEGFWDLTVYSTASQERDRIWDSLFNIILLNPIAPQSIAFYNYVNNFPLLPYMTINPGRITPVGDTIGPGVPWDEELLRYEATVRIYGIGTYANPYGINEPPIENIILTATDTYNNVRVLDVPPIV